MFIIQKKLSSINFSNFYSQPNLKRKMYRLNTFLRCEKKHYDVSIRNENLHVTYIFITFIFGVQHVG